MRAQMVQVWNSKFQVIYCWPLPVFMYRMRWLEQSWAEVGATVFEEQTSLSLNDVLKEPKTDLESPLRRQKKISSSSSSAQVMPNSISSYTVLLTCFLAPSVYNNCRRIRWRRSRRSRLSKLTEEVSRLTGAEIDWIQENGTNSFRVNNLANLQRQYFKCGNRDTEESERDRTIWRGKWKS